MKKSAPKPFKARESRIVSEPATVVRCQADYKDGEADRLTSAKQWRRAGGV